MSDDMQAAELSFGRGDHFGAILRLRHIRPHEANLPAIFASQPHRFVAARRIHIRDHHTSAFLSKKQRGLAPDATGAAGHNTNFVQ